MKILEGLFGGEKQERERQNAGGNFVAIPPQAPGETTQEEIDSVDPSKERASLKKEIERLETKPELGLDEIEKLKKLREKSENLNENIRKGLS